MEILNFKQFESYLDSSRQPLYHWCSFGRFEDNIKGNKLTAKTQARGPVSICFSRNINWSNDGGNQDIRFVLDQDLLIRNGYKIYPIQELMYAKEADIRKSRRDIDRNVWKGNLDWIKKGQRGHPHNIETLPKKIIMETEFEERILTDVNNLGKYLLFIDIPDRKYLVKDLINYLIKYPNIKIRLVNGKRSHITEEIDIQEEIDKAKYYQDTMKAKAKNLIPPPDFFLTK